MSEKMDSNIDKYATSIEALKILMAAGINPRGAEPGWKIFFQAAEDNNIEIVKLFLDTGVSPNVVGIYGATAIRAAVEYNHIEMVEYLLSRGASPNQTSLNQSILAIAIYGGYMDIAKLLLDSGANVNTPSMYGTTLLMNLVIYSRSEAVKFLIKESKSLDLDAMDDMGMSALAYAVEYADNTTENLLLGAGANPKAKSKAPKIILMNACLNGDIDTVRTLIGSLPFDINESLTYIYGINALTYAAIKGHTEIIRFLLDAGADPNKHSVGVTPLNSAAANNHIETVRILLNAGARFDVSDSEGLTALGHAMSIEVAELLLNAGADIKDASLADAVAHGSIEFIQYLLEKGADLEKDNSDDLTPLMEAAKRGREDVVKLLIEYGVTIDTKAIEMATRMGHMSIANLLISMLPT